MIIGMSKKVMSSGQVAKLTVNRHQIKHTKQMQKVKKRKESGRITH